MECIGCKCNRPVAPTEGEPMTPTPPYPAYKDSGVSWLGHVPEQWEVRRTKTLFQSRKQLNTDGSETNVLSLTLRGVVNNDPDNPEGLVPKDYKTYQIFEKDDLVFKLIDLENIRTSRVGLVHERGIMSPAYVRLTLSGIGDIRFYYQQFFDLYLRCIYNQIGEGVRSTIGWSDLANVRILAPPLPEQTAIVRFLDYMDRRIRRSIRAKQKLIKLLEEYRQALIHQAVTGKIDVRTGKPYPAYKDSGVAWLGEVPEHWEVRRLGSMTQILNGATPSSSVPEYWDGDIVWVTPDDLGKLKDRYIDDSSRRITREGYDACGTTLAPAGSIVVSTRAPIGHLGILRIAACANQGCRLLVPQAATATEYLYHVLLAARPSLEVLGQGSTFLELSRSKLRAFLVPFPPLPEQTAIVEYLDAQTAKLDTAIAAARREIELLLEYREGLIADVVTGKVDVREVAAQLPEEPPEEVVELFEEEAATGEADGEDAKEETDDEE